MNKKVLKYGECKQLLELIYPLVEQDVPGAETLATHIVLRLMSMIDDNFRPPDMYGDCQKFTKLYFEKTGKTTDGKIDAEFITKMVNDEMKELAEASDLAGQIDALLDAIYYILQHIATTGLDIRPIWNLIQKANMTKFEKGYMREDGKWCKPDDFVSPGDEIRKIIKVQLKK